MVLSTLNLMGDVVISGSVSVSGDFVGVSGELSAPNQAGSFSPANGATRIAVTPTLSWSPGGGATGYDVYFDTVNPPLTKVVDNVNQLSYSPAELNYSTVYYWRVDPKNSIGTTTGTVLSFTTYVPIAANTFVDFEAGNDEDLLTTEMLDTGTHESLGTWSFPEGNSALNVELGDFDFYTPFTVGASTYLGTGTRVIRGDNSFQTNSARLGLTVPVDNLSLGLFITYGDNNYGPGSYRGLDLVSINGANDGSPHFVVMQQSNSATPKVICHTENGGTTGISITLSKRYWLTVRYVKGDKGYVALYDPDTWTQVGSTQELEIGNTQAVSVTFGARDAHGGDPSSFTYFDNLVIDTTDATFPLGP